MILLLLILEFLSMLLIFSGFGGIHSEQTSVVIVLLIFTCVAAEGAMSLTLFLVRSRTRRSELNIRP